MTSCKSAASISKVSVAGLVGIVASRQGLTTLGPYNFGEGFIATFLIKTERSDDLTSIYADVIWTPHKPKPSEIGPENSFTVRSLLVGALIGELCHVAGLLPPNVTAEGIDG